MMLSSVVLPDPDAPTTATHSPTLTSRSTSRSATTGAIAPNVRPTSASATIGRGTTSATALATLLQSHHDEVAVREHPFERRHADVAIGRETGPHGHDLDPFTGGPLHPGPSVRPERDSAQRDRELRAPGRSDRDRQPQRCSYDAGRIVPFHRHPEVHVEAIGSVGSRSLCHQGDPAGSAYPEIRLVDQHLRSLLDQPGLLHRDEAVDDDV